WRTDAAYLVTGGFGGIALEVARWMARQGARRLILLGRHTLPPRAAWEAIDPQSAEGARVNAVLELEALGANVDIASVDVGAAGQPALSVNWGAWSRVGMAAPTSADDGRRRSATNESIAPEVGVGMLAMLVARDVARAAVLPMDWTEWKRLYPAFAAAPLLRH